MMTAIGGSEQIGGRSLNGVINPSGKIDFGLLKTAMPKTKTTNAQGKESLEQKLWKAADKLRKNIDAAEYKHIVLGLVFLKYISDSFEQLHEKLIAGEGDYAGADPEDPEEYKAENVFFVPAEARWSALHWAFRNFFDASSRSEWRIHQTQRGKAWCTPKVQFSFSSNVSHSII